MDEATKALPKQADGVDPDTRHRLSDKNPLWDVRPGTTKKDTAAVLTTTSCIS